MNFDLEYLKRDLRLNLFILFYSLFAKEINENSVRQEEKKEKSTNATKKKEILYICTIDYGDRLCPTRYS